MDYEKKYKEALERAKKWHNAPNIDKIPTYGNRIIEEIFPELVEPEDERIRKEILDCFRAMKQQGCFPSKHKEQYDSWIAWLEKQGKQKTWSEEDEKILKDILVDVKFEGYNNDMLANSYKKINWLKSLKDRVLHE